MPLYRFTMFVALVAIGGLVLNGASGSAEHQSEGGGAETSLSVRQSKSNGVFTIDVAWQGLDADSVLLVCAEPQPENAYQRVKSLDHRTHIDGAVAIRRVGTAAGRATAKLSEAPLVERVRRDCRLKLIVASEVRVAVRDKAPPGPKQIGEIVATLQFDASKCTDQFQVLGSERGPGLSAAFTGLGAIAIDHPAEGGFEKYLVVEHILGMVSSPLGLDLPPNEFEDD